MKTQHRTFSLGDVTLQRIDFAPDTFTDACLLWLPHHAKLQFAGKKRKAEHLAGRLAAFHALREHNIRHIPDIGDNRQPLWPPGWHGSISHSGTTALAVVSRAPVGVDLETVFSASLSEKLAVCIITPDERAVLNDCGLPFPLALTLAFSAKESAYKAFSFATTELPDFTRAQVIALDAQHITLQLNTAFAPSLAGQTCLIDWRQEEQQVITLVAKTFQAACVNNRRQR